MSWLDGAMQQSANHLLAAKKAPIVVGGVVMIWLCLYMMTSTSHASRAGSTEQLRADILADSKRYIRVLAEETRNVQDGPYAHDQKTGYDLKKTLAFLLDSMLGRLARMERIMGNVEQALKDEGSMVQQQHDI